MIHTDTLIWTKRGWLKAEELIIGDVTISYNQLRNCTEYDLVSNIQIDYGINPFLGLKTHSMNMLVTPDHPFITMNKVTKTSSRKIIDDVFLTSIKDSLSILYTSAFEPYSISQSLDDIAWSARVASTFGNVRAMPVDLFDEVWNLVENIAGIEAQHWIDIFYHWNVLESGTYWSKAIKLRNKHSRDLVSHIAPRAGFGSRFMPNPKRPTSQWIMGLSTQKYPVVNITNWYRERLETYVFNIKTNNGTFLAKKTGGTFLCACDIT